MKVAEKGALSDYLGEGKHASLGHLDDTTRKATIICDIVMGMRHVHSHGIMHRDLKPANILLDEQWRGMICDFGLCRSLSAADPPTPFAGTLRYAAPEQREGGVYYTEKVDVFTFGLVAYEIIEGFPARRSGSDELPDPPASRGSLMQNLIRQCWSLIPSERPSFDDIFKTFREHDWAILPGVDRESIKTSVLKVWKLEQARAITRQWKS
jgi:serine/threonine protein kinase